MTQHKIYEVKYVIHEKHGDFGNKRVLEDTNIIVSRGGEDE